jgi:hypothetical protein
MRRLVRIFGSTWRARNREWSRTRPLVRKVSLVTAVAVAAVGFVTAVAAGASTPNRPTITFVSPSPSEGATAPVGVAVDAG